MFVLDSPRKEKLALNKVYEAAGHHAKLVLPLLGPLYTAVKRHAEMHGHAVFTKSEEAPGVQLRFTHRHRYFKVRYEHEGPSVVLAEVLGQREGPVLERFIPTDGPLDVDRKMRVALGRIKPARH